MAKVAKCQAATIGSQKNLREHRVIELLTALVEGIIALIGAIIEGVAGLFGASAGAIEGFSLIDFVLVLLVSLIELVYWLALAIVEIFRALTQRRKPRKVQKPILWRPSKKTSDSKSLESNTDQEGETPYPKKGDPRQIAINVGLVITTLLLLYFLIAG